MLKHLVHPLIWPDFQVTDPFQEPQYLHL